MCSLKDLCSWPTQSFDAYTLHYDSESDSGSEPNSESDSGSEPEMDTASFVFLSWRMYVMIALFTTPHAGGHDLMSRLDAGWRVGVMLLANFTDMVATMAPDSPSPETQKEARDQCRKVVICLRFFGEWLHVILH